MKSILLILFFIFIPKLANSQISEYNKTIYMDSTWNETTKKKHIYYRIIEDYYSDKDIYKIKDYYKSGVLHMEGVSKSRDEWYKEGEFVVFYENGNKKSVSNYTKGKKTGKETQWYVNGNKKSDFNYINSKLDGQIQQFHENGIIKSFSNYTNGLPIGKETRWYENGNKKQEGEYILNDKKNKSEYKINDFWDSNGIQKITDGNGDYEERDDKSFGSGKIKEGIKDGVWQGWIINVTNKYTETYANGQFISGTILDKNNIESAYTVLEKKPEPKFGMADFYKYFAQNYKIPNNLPKGTSGKIYLRFVIDIDGKLVEPRIIRDLGYGTGGEAIRILSDYKDFIPGEQRGIKVRCSYSLPISIQTSN